MSVADFSPLPGRERSTAKRSGEGGSAAFAGQVEVPPSPGLLRSPTSPSWGEVKLEFPA